MIETQGSSLDQGFKGDVEGDSMEENSLNNKSINFNIIVNEVQAGYI